MNTGILLLTLLIHQYSQDEYYRKHDLYIAKQKKWVEGFQKEPFDSLPQDKQTYYLDSWFWPPWRFNDIVGYAEIKKETGRTVIGNLYLPEGRASKAEKKPLLLNYVCASADFEQDNLQSLREAIIEVVKRLNSILAKRKWGVEFNQDMINHTDFLKMVINQHNDAN